MGLKNLIKGAVGGVVLCFFVIFILIFMVLPYMMISESDAKTKTQFKVIKVETYTPGLGSLVTVEYNAGKNGHVKAKHVYVEDHKAKVGEIYKGRYEADDYKEVTLEEKVEGNKADVPPVIPCTVIFVVGGVVISEFLSGRRTGAV